MLSSAYMQMIDKGLKTRPEQSVVEMLSEKLPKLFYEDDLRKTLDDLQARQQFSDTTKNRIKKKIFEIPFKPTPKSFKKIHSLDRKKISEEEILQLLSTTPRQYVSHLSAMYFLGLLNQRPKDYFISREIDSKLRSTPEGLNPLNIRQSFLKPARRTKAHAEYLGQKFYLIEKIDLKEIGVISHQIKFEQKDIELKITSVERTFIDSVISPHYSGGISTIVSSFRNSNLKAKELKRIYKVINPIYPYWQNIGFLLDCLGSIEDANEWAGLFKTEKKVPFYIAHEAKSFWSFSEKWNVHYPEGSFHVTNN